MLFEEIERFPLFFMQRNIITAKRKIKFRKIDIDKIIFRKYNVITK